MINEENKIGRRGAIGGLEAGLAVLAVSLVFGSQTKMQRGSSARGELEGPATKHPKPPFNGQSQPLMQALIGQIYGSSGGAGPPTLKLL